MEKETLEIVKRIRYWRDLYAFKGKDVNEKAATRLEFKAMSSGMSRLLIDLAEQVNHEIAAAEDVDLLDGQLSEDGETLIVFDEPTAAEIVLAVFLKYYNHTSKLVESESLSPESLTIQKSRFELLNSIIETIGSYFDSTGTFDDNGDEDAFPDDLPQQWRTYFKLRRQGLNTSQHEPEPPKAMRESKTTRGH